MTWKRLIPEPVKAALRPILRPGDRVELKHDSEMQYWRNRFQLEGGNLANAHYQRTMLAMADEPDDKFLQGKIVADFGCGPRGSLCWAESARVRVGIDVLVDRYMELGIKHHDICYIRSSEREIPLPSEYIDVLYTVNALDHVVNLEVICGELLRILASGGELIASFNLEEPATDTEPQTLTEAALEALLLRHFEVISYRAATQGRKADVYEHFFDGAPAPTSGQRYLWVRARKLAKSFNKA